MLRMPVSCKHVNQLLINFKLVSLIQVLLASTYHAKLASVLRACVCVYVNLKFLEWRGTILQLELSFDLPQLNKYSGLSAAGNPSSGFAEAALEK